MTRDDGRAGIDFAQWLADERRTPAPRIIRPSIELPAALMQRVDRVARVSGMTRSQLVAHILDRWLASWRPLHDQNPTTGAVRHADSPPAPARTKWTLKRSRRNTSRKRARS